MAGTKLEFRSLFCQLLTIIIPNIFFYTWYLLFVCNHSLFFSSSHTSTEPLCSARECTEHQAALPAGWISTAKPMDGVTEGPCHRKQLVPSPSPSPEDKIHRKPLEKIFCGVTWGRRLRSQSCDSPSLISLSRNPLGMLTNSNFK